MRKICFVTGSRAEYGLLSGLMNAVKNDPELQLQIIATNMHLSPEFGLTYREIEKDGFTIDKKVEMLLSSDTAVGTSKSNRLTCANCCIRRKLRCSFLLIQQLAQVSLLDLD